LYHPCLLEQLECYLPQTCTCKAQSTPSDFNKKQLKHPKQENVIHGLVLTMYIPTAHSKIHYGV
jgi:hypothetical protein